MPADVSRLGELVLLVILLALADSLDFLDWFLRQRKNTTRNLLVQSYHGP